MSNRRKHDRRRRTETAILGLLIFVICGLCSGSAFAQDTAITRAAPKSEVGIASLVGATTEVAQLPNALLLRKTTHAVFRAISSGLVLIDLDGKRSESSLYVKFGKDAMPSLRWLTRF